MQKHIQIDQGVLAEFCKQNHITKLSLFGSVLREDFSPDSDIDILIEFDPDVTVGLIKLAGIEQQLAEILGADRPLDLRTPQDLSRYFREEVLRQAEVQYAA